jgi:hypothetical protein
LTSSVNWIYRQVYAAAIPGKPILWILAPVSKIADTQHFFWRTGIRDWDLETRMANQLFFRCGSSHITSYIMPRYLSWTCTFWSQVAHMVTSPAVISLRWVKQVYHGTGKGPVTASCWASQLWSERCPGLLSLTVRCKFTTVVLFCMC